MVDPERIEVKIVRKKMKPRFLLEATSITRIDDEEIVKSNLSNAAATIIPTVGEFRLHFFSNP